MATDPVELVYIAIPSPLKEPLVYRVPCALRGRIAPGMRALIPLGKRRVTGVVTDFLSHSPLKEIKDVLSLEDEQPILDVPLLQLAQWVAQYYLTSLGEVLATILPHGLRSQSLRVAVAKEINFSGRGATANKIFDAIKKGNGRLGIKTLVRQFPGGHLYRALDKLEAAGAIEIRERLPEHRKRNWIEQPNTTAFRKPLSLSGEQRAALQAIEERLEQGGYETFLLHGVTGSGKTEIYLQAMERVRHAGRRSLILIPEISLTPQLMDRLNARFPGRVGLLHSALTPSERWAQWWRIRRGEVDVVVGVRSAVFAPVPDLALIVVDEEHDPSYKQDEGLRYNARDIAVVRGRLLNCPVVLGSATPAVESYDNCSQGRYRLLEMAQRVEQRALPRIEAIDLRAEFMAATMVSASRAQSVSAQSNAEAGSYPLISRRLEEALKDNYRASRQSLIFLNRRGFANFLQCRFCGFVFRCSHCSVTLTLHMNQKILSCHHCGFRQPVSDLCAACGNSALAGVGVGTERIEEELSRLLPQARIARMDRDTTGKRGSHAGLIRRWEKGEIDVLIGTQMITKGHDVAGVTLVGALLADVSLNLPDFRAAERTFQLLSQVAGRSGRGRDPGRVIIQTYAPEHYAIRHLIDHDYRGFFASEIEFRRALNYPPFARLVQLRFDGLKRDQVESRAKAVAARLRAMQQQDEVSASRIEILGPAPAPIQRLRNRYRWRILLKGKKGSPLLRFARQVREIIPTSRSLRLHIDVDPYNML